jgi:DNA modification methylase
MNKVFFGDCRDNLRQMAAAGVTVQMCVTSPPYFGLRDYGHEGQLGLEQTPGDYVAAMVEVFRAVRDVLADDGTLWLNIGDSYAGSMGGSFKSDEAWQAFIDRAKEKDYLPGVRARTPYQRTRMQVEGCKPKDLIGIPWMLAFALRSDGWYLRQEVIWDKPNAIPEPVKDRPTRSHETLFLLSKRRAYYYDHEAIKEPSEHNTSGKRNRRSVWTIPKQNFKGAHFAVFPPALVEPCILAGSRPGDIVLDPFMGSGTTAAVAVQHGRQYIGCELNQEYAPLQAERIGAVMPSNDNNPTTTERTAA